MKLLKPATHTLPEPGELLFTVLQFCSQGNLVELAQEDIGKLFVREVGVLHLFVTYAELGAIFPKKSDLNWALTLEALLTNLIVEYINHYFGKFLQDVMRAQYGKRAPTWRPEHSGDYADRLAVLVAVLNAYAEQLRAKDASFVPPDPDAMRGYVIYEDVFFAGQQGPYYAHGLVTRQWLRAFARTQLPSTHQTLREALLRRIALDFAATHPHWTLPGTFTCRVFKTGESAAQLEAALAVIEEVLSGAPLSTSVESAPGESGASGEEEEPERFSFTIDITGCQAEWCTHRVEVAITRAELLAWAHTSDRVMRETRREGISVLVLDYLIRERGEAHLDDHDHDIELDFDGQDQLYSMAQAILDDREELRP